MARAAHDYLADVLEAIAMIRGYTRGGEAAFRANPMARDAVIARLIQIGQAVKDAQDEGLDLPRLSPSIPWRNIAGMRDRLVHKYWDADPGIVWSVVRSQLGKLESAARSVRARSRPPKRSTGKRAQK